MLSHDFDKEKWSKLDIFNQMGNIGSEVGRALRAKKKGDEESKIGALYRGLDLFDATAEAWKSKPTRLKEILRAREIFAQSVLNEEHDSTLESYFMQYALAARMRQFS